LVIIWIIAFNREKRMIVVSLCNHMKINNQIYLLK